MLTTILIAVLGFVTIAGVGFAFVGAGGSADTAVKRAQSLGVNDKTTGADGKVRRKPMSREASAEARRKDILNKLKDAERKERKARVTLRNRLQQAGLSGDVKKFWLISAVVAVVAGGALFMAGQKPLIVLGVAFAAGLGLPRWVIGFMAGRRTKKFTAEFANAVDVIIRGIKSGLPVHDCLKIIGRESPAPLGPMFQRLVENVGMGLTLEQGLEKMYETMPTPELRFFTIVVAIQQKTGGNLAEALTNLTVVLRARKMMREKIKALSSEATASAGIIGCLPPGVMTIVMVTTPSYMSLMFTDPRGHLMLLGSAMWMGAGVFVMKKMISFKI
ncbi:MAG TPA: type II secretion system F family protein [Caulobacteraceae bacterium]|nr:type II secretion system F family protein [Caulobacteraceae bacterium]